MWDVLMLSTAIAKNVWIINGDYKGDSTITSCGLPILKAAPSLVETWGMKKLSSSNIIALIQRPNTICAVTKTYVLTLCPKDEY